MLCLSIKAKVLTYKDRTANPILLFADKPGPSSHLGASLPGKPGLQTPVLHPQLSIFFPHFTSSSGYLLLNTPHFNLIIHLIIYLPILNVKLCASKIFMFCSLKYYNA